MTPGPMTGSCCGRALGKGSISDQREHDGVVREGEASLWSLGREFMRRDRLGPERWLSCSEHLALAQRI